MRKTRRGLVAAIIVLSLALSGLILFAANLRQAQADPTEPMLQDSAPADPSQDTSTVPSTAPSTLPSTAPTTEPATAPTTEPTTEPTTAPTTVPTEPPVVKVSTATIGATGDILLHDKVIRSGYDQTTDSFDYSYIFEFFQSYTSAVDYAVANLEVTLIQKPDSDGLKGYNGYPRFNSPDEIVDALKGAGFDMLLTANNHSYDSGHDGLIRTAQIIADKGLSSIGTYRTTEEKRYQVVDVNGISIGMINYTYNTGIKEDGSVSLNGIPLTAEDSQLVNSFNNWALEEFYAALQTQLDAMRAEGAEAIVLYIHWGDEYNTAPNAKQQEIAQALCNMGIDVIVGNHAHVAQPVELLTNENDENKKTLCLYSTGNSVSNISRADNRPLYTEDGMLFTFTFAKYSDGTVVVESADVLPTWVWRHDVDGVRKFSILTLDDEIADWKSHLDISDDVLAECQASYDRTMGIVGEGLTNANAWFASHQAAVEAALGVSQ